MRINKRFIFRFAFIFVWLPAISGTVGCSQAMAQNSGGKTLTVYLKELNARHGERVSFSPTITDKVFPYKLSAFGTLEESLKKLLRGTNLGFRDINGYYYIYIKMKKDVPPPVQLIPEVEPEPQPEQEEKKEPLPPLTAGPKPVVFPSRPDAPGMAFYYPVIQSPNFPRSPRFAVKTNLLYDATATVNLGFEFAIANKWTIDLSGNLNAWTFSGNRKFKHVMLQPELRYWTCERFNGHFFGLHLHGGIFNVGALPSLGGLVSENMQQQRYEGNFYGGGISYGYHMVLSGRWSLEPSLGIGYARINYDKYPCGNCGVKIKTEAKNYFGPTKLSISLIYNIK